ncbi:MAG: radical SAM protein [Candidatus Omnitrophica bacterium]|nr:radical SAM protein [Candidatus Omnitrophota bacterium]
MKILLSSIGVQSGTDLQLALYYLKSYLVKGKNALKPLPDVQIRIFHEEDTVGYISNKILKTKPQLIGFSCYIWNIEHILQVCRRIKKADPAIFIVLGGPEVSPRANEILQKEKTIDAVVRGEGEATFAELVSSLGQDLSNLGQDLSKVCGLSYRQGKVVVNNPGRAQIADLAAIPSPYLARVVDLKDKNIVDLPLETTRGCSFRCSYCYYHKNFPRVRYFSLSRVEKELKLILSSRPKEVYLMDATFNACLKRAKEVLRLFIKYNKNSSLHVELKAELVDEELARLLQKANCLNIEIGIQSTNLKTLRAVNRGFNREKFKKGIRLLNKYNIFYEIQLIDALPFQSYADLLRSLDWLYSLHPARVTIFPLAMLPGTTLRERAAGYGIIYDPRPPYHAQKSCAMSGSEVLKVKSLRFAMERLYDSHVFQETFFDLQSKGKIRFSDIFEDWVRWESRFKRRCQDYPVFLNRKSPEFLEYTCRKRGKFNIFKRLLPVLKKTLADYQAAYYS